ncbi:hypothetical protein PFISCL1PPCAC_389, partial [Pristionchus fissidentatus]
YKEMEGEISCEPEDNGVPDQETTSLLPFSGNETAKKSSEPRKAGVPGWPGYGIIVPLGIIIAIVAGTVLFIVVCKKIDNAREDANQRGTATKKDTKKSKSEKGSASEGTSKQEK